MNIFLEMRALVIKALDQMVSDGVLSSKLDHSNVTVELPRDRAHGDVATNAALVISGQTGKAPREIATSIAKLLSFELEIDTVEVAGPGFINISLKNSVWHKVVKSILQLGPDYGRSSLGKGKTVNVEYVSANPTGPLHIGHARGAVFGDTLASLLEYAGYTVTREYYINDGGAQVNALARSVYLRYLEAHGREVAFEDGTYPGDYLAPIGESLKKKAGKKYLEKDEDSWLPEIRQFATESMMNIIRSDLALLAIKIDNYFSEKSLYGTGKIEGTIASLKEKKLIYRGVLEAPKGKKQEDWEPREQILFKSTEHGDDVDRPLIKSDGTWTYFAPDVAYHNDKIKRGFDILIDVLGADHGGYVKRMKAAVSALSDGQVSLEIKLIQLVRLFKNGEPFKMSKRSGTFVSLRNLIEQVGLDVTRFVMLTRKNDAPLDFDFDKVLEQSRENPVFYVQYAHARVRSAVRKARDMGITIIGGPIEIDYSLIADTAEICLIRKLAEWPKIVESAAKAFEPHRIAFYLYELASEFHSLWNKGNENPMLKFVQIDSFERSSAKISLISAVGIVISAGLDILGIEPAEEMR